MMISFRLPRALRVFALACLVAASGCHGEEPPSGAAALPEGVRADYAVFAQRCSKCHSLSRPLNSGIVDDDYWAMYVARMRRQPASGISPEDARVILRFLHYYSVDQRRKKEEARAKEDASPPSASAPSASPRDIDASAGER